MPAAAADEGAAPRPLVAPTSTFISDKVLELPEMDPEEVIELRQWHAPARPAIEATPMPVAATLDAPGRVPTSQPTIVAVPPGPKPSLIQEPGQHQDTLELLDAAFEQTLARAEGLSPDFRLASRAVYERLRGALAFYLFGLREVG